MHIRLLIKDNFIESFASQEAVVLGDAKETRPPDNETAIKTTKQRDILSPSRRAAIGKNSTKEKHILKPFSGQKSSSRKEDSNETDSKNALSPSRRNTGGKKELSHDNDTINIISPSRRNAGNRKESSKENDSRNIISPCREKSNSEKGSSKITDSRNILSPSRRKASSKKEMSKETESRNTPSPSLRKVSSKKEPSNRSDGKHILTSSRRRTKSIRKEPSSNETNGSGLQKGKSKYKYDHTSKFFHSFGTIVTVPKQLLENTSESEQELYAIAEKLSSEQSHISVPSPDCIS